MATVVTGAAGFIGGHLVEALVGAGHDVVGIDRRPVAARPGLRPLRCDLAAPDAETLRVLGSAGMVFHLAGRPGVRDTSPGVDAARVRDNVDATRTVVAAVPLDIPLVVTSSSSVYGGSRGLPCHEDDQLQPIGGYARSKAAAENVCAERLARGGIVAVARPFTVVGPGQRDDMALSQWVAAVAARQPVTVYGGLHRRRDVTDVADVVHGLQALSGLGRSGVVNLGTGVGHTLDELLRAVSQALGSEAVDIRVLTPPAGDVDCTLADTRRCAEWLGFVPRTDLQDVVARQVAASRALAAVPA